MKTIPLTDGVHVAMVDDLDFPEMSRHVGEFARPNFPQVEL